MPSRRSSDNPMLLVAAMTNGDLNAADVVADQIVRRRGAGAIVMTKTVVQVESELFGRVLHSVDPALARWFE